MSSKPQPPTQDDDSETGRPHLGGSDLAKFAGALLAAVGLGSLVNRLRKRSERSDMEQKPQRRVVGSQRKDPAEVARRLNEGPPTSDVEEEKAAKADEDAAIEAKRALGHEPYQVALRPIVTAGVLITLLAVLALGAMAGMFAFFLSRPAGEPPPSSLGITQPTPPAPRLQTDAVADWQTLQATEVAKLNGYGYTNQGAGKVHIPIERAMDLLIQRGLPVAPGSNRQFNDQTPNLDSSGGQDLRSTGAGAPQNTGETQTQPTATAP